MANPSCCIVVPCYNEALRLRGDEFQTFARTVLQNGNGRILFVNDGSSDSTAAVLDALVSQSPAQLAVLHLPKNQGKAEAVRLAMQQAIAQGAQVVGYLDADLATPLREIWRLFEVLNQRQLDVAIGSRVALQGYDIKRNAARHYMGRVFATLASGVLRWRIYDTQCGAKLFRSTAALSAALSEKFLSRWGFDIELLGRLVIGVPGVSPTEKCKIAEMPLETWHDVAGSKIQPIAMVNTVRQLARIDRDLRQRRTLMKLS